MRPSRTGGSTQAANATNIRRAPFVSVLPDQSIVWQYAGPDPDQWFVMAAGTAPPVDAALDTFSPGSLRSSAGSQEGPGAIYVIGVTLSNDPTTGPSNVVVTSF